jgi:hypothetical protein
LLYLWGGDIFITEACHNPDHQESLSSLLWMPDWGPGQELGPAHMLQYLCSKPSKVVEPQKAIMPFAIPMVWREQTSHISDCYFCMVPHFWQGFSKKKKWTLYYLNIPSAMRPIPHGEALPIPEPPEIFTLESEKEEDDEISDMSEPSISKDRVHTQCGVC